MPVRTLNLTFHQQKIVRRLSEVLKNDSHPMFLWGYTPNQIGFDDSLKAEPIHATIEDLREIERLRAVNLNEDDWSYGSPGHSCGGCELNVAIAGQLIRQNFGHTHRELVMLAVHELAAGKVAVHVREPDLIALIGIPLTTLRTVIGLLVQDKLLTTAPERQSAGSYETVTYSPALTPRGWEWIEDPRDEAQPAMELKIGSLVMNNSGQVQGVVGDNNALEQNIQGAKIDELLELFKTHTEAIVAAVAQVSRGEAAAIAAESQEAAEAAATGKADVAKRQMASVANRVISLINKSGEFIENAETVVKTTLKLAGWLNVGYLIYLKWLQMHAS